MAHAFKNDVLAKQFQTVPLSRPTVSRRIVDIEHFLVEKLPGLWSRSRSHGVGVGVQKEFLITGVGVGVGVEKIYADSNTDSILVNFMKIRVC